MAPSRRSRCQRFFQLIEFFCGLGRWAVSPVRGHRLAALTAGVRASGLGLDGFVHVRLKFGERLLDLGKLAVDLQGVLEFAGGLLEFTHGATHGFRQVGQFFRAQNDQRQHGNDDQFRHADAKHGQLLVKK
jgi:hypothetical protein